MRKLALAGIAGMLIGGAAVAAAASSAVHAVGVSVSRDRLSAGSPSHPQGVKLTTALSWEGLKPGNAPTINKIDLWFPTGTRYNGASYPSCSYARLNAAGPSACPKDSIMGSGVATAFADTVVTRAANHGRQRRQGSRVLLHGAEQPRAGAGAGDRAGHPVAGHVGLSLERHDPAPSAGRRRRADPGSPPCR